MLRNCVITNDVTGFKDKLCINRHTCIKTYPKILPASRALANLLLAIVNICGGRKLE